MASPSPTEQIEQAEEHKKIGNARFKEGDLKKALGAYHKVFFYVNGLQVPGEKSEASSYTDMMGKSAAASQVPTDRVEDVKRLKESTHLNMAACYLKQGQYSKCVTAATKAMASGPVCKAYFRRGQANLELRNLDEAKEDLERARQLAPTDTAIAAELKRLAQAFKQHDAKEKKKFAKMFGKMAEEDKTDSAAEPRAPVPGAAEQAEAPSATAGGAAADAPMQAAGDAATAPAPGESA